MNVKKIFFFIRKKVNKINNKLFRKKKLIPGVIYGPYISKSINILIEEKELLKIKYIIYPIFDINKLIDNIIFLENKKKNICLNVIIKEVQYHPYKLKIKHIDFYYKKKVNY